VSSPPRLALTPGDPGGIGPEIVAAALAEPSVRAAAEIVVVDRAGGGTHPARPTREGGRASLAAFEEAIDLAARGECDGIVTGPIDKRSLARAGSRFVGHTDLLRRRLTGATLRMMMVAPDRLRVVLVTEHIPLARVAESLSTEGVLATIADTRRGLVDEIGIDAPRLALLGLNPHAGDGGVLGREEIDLLGPALERARDDGIEIEGPFSPDGFFAAGTHTDFDAVVALYHDQGLIPVKIFGGPTTIGVTLGLPFVRTSVGHGTAFEIAGRGKADPTSLVTAIRTAADLVARRR
jgi:4-hydroxythreonine-4-phosphate dehydrogenase